MAGELRPFQTGECHDLSMTNPEDVNPEVEEVEVEIEGDDILGGAAGGRSPSWARTDRT